MSDHEQDPVAARLRAALRAEAETVDPSDDGLQSIRERVAERPWWQSPAAFAVAAAVVLGLLVGAGFALVGGDEGRDPRDGSVVADPPSTSPTPSQPSPSESSTPTGSPSSEEGELRGDLVWVYYVMDDPAAGPRLYREQHRVEPEDRMSAEQALREMLREPAQDPDYHSPWPKGTDVRSYSVDGDTATVDLTDFLRTGTSTEGAGVQQLVYTVTANDPAVQQVVMRVDGEVPSTGHATYRDPVSRAPRVDVQGLIWLLEPAEGQVVASPVKIVGYGTAFEGTISWEVRSEGSDAVVAEGFTQGGANGEFAEFADTVELEPGTYQLRAFESSAEDGRPLHVDTKSFTVR